MNVFLHIVAKSPVGAIIRSSTLSVPGIINDATSVHDLLSFFSRKLDWRNRAGDSSEQSNIDAANDIFRRKVLELMEGPGSEAESMIVDLRDLLRTLLLNTPIAPFNRRNSAAPAGLTGSADAVANTSAVAGGTTASGAADSTGGTAASGAADSTAGCTAASGAVSHAAVTIAGSTAADDTACGADPASAATISGTDCSSAAASETATSAAADITAYAAVAATTVADSATTAATIVGAAVVTNAVTVADSATTSTAIASTAAVVDASSGAARFLEDSIAASQIVQYRFVEYRCCNGNREKLTRSDETAAAIFEISFPEVENQKQLVMAEMIDKRIFNIPRYATGVRAEGAVSGSKRRKIDVSKLAVESVVERRIVGNLPAFLIFDFQRTKSQMKLMPEIDMRQYVLEQDTDDCTTYELSLVVIREDIAAEVEGHYFLAGKNPHLSEWIKINDDTIESYPIRESTANNVHLAIYVRKDFSAP